MYYVVLIVSLG